MNTVISSISVSALTKELESKVFTRMAMVRSMFFLNFHETLPQNGVRALSLLLNLLQQIKQVSLYAEKKTLIHVGSAQFPVRRVFPPRRNFNLTRF